jgi:hypothetical protein
VEALIKEKDLLEAIAECQGERNPNANTCIKLSAYYTILNQMRKEPVEQYSFASEPEMVTLSGDTEFMKAIEGMPANDVIMIMDELMTTLSIVNPRLYRGVMNKL